MEGSMAVFERFFHPAGLSLTNCTQGMGVGLFVRRAALVRRNWVLVPVGFLANETKVLRLRFHPVCTLHICGAVAA